MFKTNRIVKSIAAILLVACIGFTVVSAWYNWSSTARYNAVIQQRRAAGLPVELFDLQTSPVSEDKDAAAKLVAVADDLKLLRSRISEIVPDGNLLNRYLTNDEITQLAPLWVEQQDLIAQLIDISKLPSFFIRLPDNPRFETVFDQSISLQLNSAANAADILRTKGASLFAENKLSESFDCLLASLAMGQLMLQAPTSDGFIYSAKETTLSLKTLNAILQQSALSPTEHQELLAQLDRIEPFVIYKKTLQADAAAYTTGLLEQEGALTWLNRGRLYSALIYQYQMYDNYVRDAEMDFTTWDDKYGAMDYPFSWNPFVNVVNLNHANCVAYRTLAERIDILKRSIIILSTLQQNLSSGSSQIKLENLGLNEKVLRDPYSGKTLLLQANDQEGWKIYSVGSNRKDDGGNFENFSDCGIGPYLPAEPTEPPASDDSEL